MAKAKIPAVATPEGRLSFPHLGAPETTGKFPCNKYVATLLIPKTSNFDALKTACLEAAKAEWPHLNITVLGQLRLPFRDGDEKKNLLGMEGCFYIKSTSKSKPPIYGANRKEYLGPIKGGDFVRFSVVAWPFQLNLERETGEALKAAGKTVVEGVDDRGAKTWWRPAITFLLDAVQFRREGPSLGGGGGAAAFDDGTPDAVAGNDIFS